MGTDVGDSILRPLSISHPEGVAFPTITTLHEMNEWNAMPCRSYTHCHKSYSRSLRATADGISMPSYSDCLVLKPHGCAGRDDSSTFRPVPIARFVLPRITEQINITGVGVLYGKKNFASVYRKQPAVLCFSYAARVFKNILPRTAIAKPLITSYSSPRCGNLAFLQEFEG